MPVSILRPFNTFGPRQSAGAIIPTIITQINKKNNLKLGSLHPTRDFTFIEDTTDAFLASIKSNKGIGEIVNVGSGFEISIKQLAHKIAKLWTKIYIKKEPSILRPKNSEVDRL